MESHCVAQAGLELWVSSDPPTSVSHVARITGVHYYAQLLIFKSVDLKNMQIKEKAEKERKEG